MLCKSKLNESNTWHNKVPRAKKGYLDSMYSTNKGNGSDEDALTDKVDLAFDNYTFLSDALLERILTHQESKRPTTTQKNEQMMPTQAISTYRTSTSGTQDEEFRHAILTHGKKALRRYALLPTLSFRKKKKQRTSVSKPVENLSKRRKVNEVVRKKRTTMQVLRRERRAVPLKNFERLVCKKVLFQGPLSEELVRENNVVLTRENLQCLGGQYWLNDEVINAYMYVLRKHATELGLKCYFHSSFFFTKLNERNTYTYSNVRRWTARGAGKCNLFEQDKVCIPINLDNTHWAACVIHIQTKRIFYYDSLGQSGTRIMNLVFRYLKDEARSKLGTTVHLSKWKLINT